ncbi:MAG: hypothetical protein QNJ87_04620 [Gammaproteobacteria bacterium]|nr:hypothetical protein [Gammaproteobacteria bacterium]MDJ0871029.1 hypothetical protein [Gammaproteobacteria bacterium]
MQGNSVKRLAIVLGILAVSPAMTATTQAATITGQPNPVSLNPVVDPFFEVTLAGRDFAPTPVLSGDLKVSWDPGLLGFVGFSVINPPWDSGSLVPPLTDPDDGMYAFQVGDSGGEVGADFSIATYQFQFLGDVGESAVISLDEAVMGWFGKGTSEDSVKIMVAYGPIQVNAVPIPSAV